MMHQEAEKDHNEIQYQQSESQMLLFIIWISSLITMLLILSNDSKPAPFPGEHTISLAHDLNLNSSYNAVPV